MEGYGVDSQWFAEGKTVKTVSNRRGRQQEKEAVHSRKKPEVGEGSQTKALDKEREKGKEKPYGKGD